MADSERPEAGCVILIPPAGRRSWSAAWAETTTAEHLEWFDGDSFRDVVRWALARTTEVYLREPSGEMTRLVPPITE
ncbi:hypothetical protein [Amycolatopsis sp. NPDC051371]|uniref:hypothetical protein n=1 Tax=Amycolatopsis sp. NPDC051371 TaxID=3155800 RepID=UPI003436913F